MGKSLRPLGGAGKPKEWVPAGFRRATVNGFRP